MSRGLLLLNLCEVSSKARMVYGSKCHLMKKKQGSIAYANLRLTVIQMHLKGYTNIPNVLSTSYDATIKKTKMKENNNNNKKTKSVKEREREREREKIKPLSVQTVCAVETLL